MGERGKGGGGGRGSPFLPTHCKLHNPLVVRSVGLTVV